MKRISLLTLLLFCAVGASAYQEKEKPPAGKPAENFKPPVRTDYSLANGMKVTLVPYGRVPKVFVSLTVLTGIIDEGEKTGLADLTLESMAEGSKKRDAAAFARESAEMGGSLSLSTTDDQTAIGLEVLSEFGSGAVDLIADLVQNPTFPAEGVAQHKQALARNVSVNRANAQSQAQEAFLAKMYPNHPYGRLFPSEAQIESYDVAALKSFHAANYGAARARLYVVGKFDEKAIRAAIDKAFANWTKGNPPTQTPIPKPAKPDLTLIDRPNSPQSTMKLGLEVLPPGDPSHFTQILTNNILGGSFTSRITSNIRERKGYTYSPGSQLSNRRNSTFWVENADITIGSTGPAIQEILHEIETLRTTPVGADELASAKNYMAGVFMIQNGSRVGIVSQLRNVDFHGLGPNYLENYVKNLQAVTAEQIQAYCKQVLDPSKLTMVLVGDKQQTVPQLKEIPAFKGKIAE